MDLHVNKYCRVEWTLNNFTKTSIEDTGELKSTKFAINTSNQNFSWFLKVAKAQNSNAVSSSGSNVALPTSQDPAGFATLFIHPNHPAPEIEGHPVNSAVHDPDDQLEISLNLDRVVGINLAYIEKFETLINFRCYVKNSKGEEIFILKRKLSFKAWSSSPQKTVSLKKLLNPRKKLVNGDKLVIVGLISIHESANEKYKAYMKAHMGLAQPSNESFFNNKLYSDFKIKCKDRTIPVHRNILHSVSPVFAAMFQTQMKEAKTLKVVINDIDGKVMFEMIRYIYTGRVKKLRKMAMDLLYAAEKYDLKDLKRKCFESLSTNLSKKNIFDCFEIADRYNNDTLLRNCIGFVKMYPQKFTNSPKWSQVKSTILSRAIAASHADFLQVYTFNDTLVTDSDFDMDSDSEAPNTINMDNGELF